MATASTWPPPPTTAGTGARQASYGDNAGTANSGQCTSAQNNTVSCDHTDFATQVSGTGIY